MAEDEITLNQHDHALVDHFLQGMRCFKNRVHTLNADEPWGRIFARVEVAFHRARTLFQRELQDKAAGGQK